jgi:hypothetical protein
MQVEALNEIAAQLVSSRRTIECHLGMVFRELDIKPKRGLRATFAQID